MRILQTTARCKKIVTSWRNQLTPIVLYMMTLAQAARRLE